MSSIQELLALLGEPIKNPAKTVAAYQAKTGRGAVGCIAP